MKRLSAFAYACTLLLPAVAVAQMDHAAHSGSHGAGQMPAAQTLIEPGQGAFAALSEVVRVLEADPATDWSKVDLGALRDHLVDMDRLVTHAVAEEFEVQNGLRAVVTGDEQTVETLHRMVPAHAAELAKDDRWTVEVQVSDTDVVLTVTSADAATVERIRALGFFGLMASQDHHRAHHMMIARGAAPH